MEALSLIKMIMIYSALYGIDPKLAVSIAKVESNMNPKAIGQVGEVGLFQLRPEYTPGYSSSDLKDAELNTILALGKLAQKKKQCKHKDNKTWVICYNRGITGGAKVKDAHNDRYYKKVMLEYNKLKGVRQ